MKRAWALGLLAGGLLAGFPSFVQAVTSEEVIQAVDAMTPEQARDLTERLMKKLREDRADRKAPSMGLSLAWGMTSFDKLDLPAGIWSCGDLDTDSASGGDLSVLWRCKCDYFRLGVRLAAWNVEDSERSAAGYSRARLTDYELGLLANLQFLRSERWLGWVELTGGNGAVTLETLDTPAEEASTVREFEGDYWFGDARAGLAFRCGRASSIFITGGYRLADDSALEEAGDKTGAELDASGPVATFGIALNL